MRDDPPARWRQLALLLVFVVAIPILATGCERAGSVDTAAIGSTNLDGYSVSGKFESFGLPVSIDHDSLGNIYLLDAALSGIICLNADLSFRWQRLGRGSGPGEFEFDKRGGDHSCIAVGSRVLALADNGLGRLVLYDLDGNLITQVHLVNQVFDMVIIGVDRIMLATDSEDYHIVELNAEGEIVRTFGQSVTPNRGQWRIAGFTRMARIDDSTFAALSTFWSTLRVYADSQLKSEVRVDWSGAFVGADKSTQRILKDILTSQEAYPFDSLRQEYTNARGPKDVSVSFGRCDDGFIVTMGGRAIRLRQDGTIVKSTHVNSSVSLEAGDITVVGNRAFFVSRRLGSIARLDLPTTFFR